MKLVTGHAELGDKEAGRLFVVASKNRAAWVTGSGGSEEVLLGKANANGFRLFLDKDGKSWVAVRSDLATGEVADFEHAQLGQVTFEGGAFDTEAKLTELRQDEQDELTVTVFRF